MRIITYCFVLPLLCLCSLFSCDSCDDTMCENGGTCIDGDCDCPIGYIGETCAQVDTSQIQFLLDSGVEPKTLFDQGVTLEMLYGKMYRDGFIFYLNVNDGSGMVAAKEDQGISVEWGCQDLDIQDLENIPLNQGVPEGVGSEIGDGFTNTNAILENCARDGIAAKLCRDIGPEWFLPSIKELNLMYANLYLNNEGGFPTEGSYWSSTEEDERFAWNHTLTIGLPAAFNKDFEKRVRAARAF